MQPPMPGVVDVVDVAGVVDNDNVACKANLDRAVNVGGRLPVARARYDSHAIVVYGGRSRRRCAGFGRSLLVGVPAVELPIAIFVNVRTTAASNSGILTSGSVPRTGPNLLASCSVLLPLWLSQTVTSGTLGISSCSEDQRAARAMLVSI